MHEIAVAITAVASSIEGLAFVLLMMLFFKKMG